MLLFMLFALVVIIALWCAIGRPWLRTKTWPWAVAFFAWIEPAELLLWSKSEAILWARTLQFLGVLLTALSGLGQFDLSPLMPFIPERFKWVPSMIPMVVTLAGIMNERLRRDVTKPLSVVALPADMPIEVALAVQHAEVATAQAVAAVAADAAKA